MLFTQQLRLLIVSSRHQSGKEETLLFFSIFFEKNSASAGTELNQQTLGKLRMFCLFLLSTLYLTNHKTENPN